MQKTKTTERASLFCLEFYGTSTEVRY